MSQTEKKGRRRTWPIPSVWKAIAASGKRYWSILRDSSRSRISRLSYFVAGGAGASLSGFAVLWVYLLILVPFTPGSKSLERAKRQVPSTIVSADGTELARLESLHRDWVAFDEISPFVIDALIATEDHRFYRHDGVDNRRLVSSVLRTVAGDAQGGSTLTMQLARNLFPEKIGNDRSVNRKLKEIVTARKIERVYSKEEIIETYLNTVPFLYNARGIEMAAHTYFGKKAANLSLQESATLVAMLKGTSYYNPIRHPERARIRRNVVLSLMVRNGVLTSEEYLAVSDDPINARLRRQRPAARTADHFVNQVEMRARIWAKKNGFDLESDGLTIHTSLNSTLQKNAEQAVRRQSSALQGVANVEWSTSDASVYSRDIRDYAQRARRSKPFDYFWKTRTDVVNSFIRETTRYKSALASGGNEEEAIQAFRRSASAMDSLRVAKTRLESGFVAIEPNTGHVLAWVGSRNYTATPFDHVATARRQPGSTFKPIVYAAALERGFRPYDSFEDADVNIRIGRKNIWQLASSSNEEDATITLRQALAHSRNNIAAALIAEVGIRRTAKLARKMGISSSPLVEVPSLALGTSPVSLLEMATVYNTIASGGEHFEPILITSISDSEGKTLVEYSPESDRAFSERSATQLTDMLRSVVDQGTGRRIRHQFGIQADVGGKTGTTQNNMDGWFFLMHPDVVVGSWIGFDDPRVSFRTDYWGEGAHNALFVVGDFFREGIRRGSISSSAKFDAPSYERRQTRFASRQSTRQQPNGRTDPAGSGQQETSTSNGRFALSLRSFGDAITQRARAIGEGWQPEYERDMSLSELLAPGQNHDAAGTTEHERGAEDNQRRLSSEFERQARDEVSASDNAQRTRGNRPNENTNHQTWQQLREVFDNDRLALLEEKRIEYETLTRELDRKLSELRQEPETRELERVIREAYLRERAQNPSLRRLEERLGIRLEID